MTVLRLPRLVMPMAPVRIDWSHPLAQGLIACYMPGISGVDLSGQAPTLIPGSGYHRGVTVEGPSLVADVASPPQGWEAIATPPFKTWTQLSIYWRGMPIGTSVNNNCFLAAIAWDNTAVSPWQNAAVSIGATGWTTMTVQNNNTGIAPVDMTGSFGKMISGMGTFNTAGNMTFYVNGVAKGNVAFGTGYTTTATTSINIHMESGTGGQDSNAHCNIVYFWNRELSAAEVAGLELDPYGLLISEEVERQALFVGFTLNPMRRIMM